jgi:hypothetical protein
MGPACRLVQADISGEMFRQSLADVAKAKMKLN